MKLLLLLLALIDEEGCDREGGEKSHPVVGSTGLTRE
jgi:hypothetical protein